MNPYLILLRGVNVGGKNRVPMAELRHMLEKLGYKHVQTYIASGNVLIMSEKSAFAIKQELETQLPKQFALDSRLVKVLVVSFEQLQAVVNDKPAGFGDHPETFHSDVIFMIDTTVPAVMPYFNPRDGVDRIWPGKQVVYSQRLSAERTKSRLGTIIVSPLYGSLTIRSWNTTIKLFNILKQYVNEDSVT